MSEGIPIVIAEDEPLASMALRAQVEALGYHVAGVARTGQQAADLLRTLPVRLGVFDMKMPTMTGLDAALQAFPDALTPVLLLTGFGASDLPDPIPRPPIFGLVTKPVGLAELRTGMQRALDRFDEWARSENRADDVRAAFEARRPPAGSDRDR